MRVLSFLTAAWLVLFHPWHSSRAAFPAAAGDAVRFVSAPTVTSDGGLVRIDFEVSKATDVAVYVLDAEGTVVRHLAAGVLGKNPPKPLKANSLRQRIEWDGTDDAGRRIPVQGCCARVCLGLAPKFDRFLQDRPGPISVVGLAVRPPGELFVWRTVGGVHGGSGATTCSVYGRSGRYLRTVIPFPADLPDERLAGLKRLALPDGRRVPFIFQGETRSIYPALGDIPRQKPVITNDGRVLTVGIQEITRVSLRYNQSGIGNLVIVRADGSAPEPCLGPRLVDGFLSAYGSPSLALSPGGKTIYATGLRQPKYQGPFFHAVYRGSLRAARFAPFIGDPKTSGPDATRLDTPLCLATDAKGNIYVADHGNDRVAVFRPDGKPLAALKLEQPSRIEVHRRTGAIYVLTGSRNGTHLVKLDGYSSGREICRLDLRFRDSRMHLWPVMALDDAADPPVIWVGSPWQMPLRRIEDRGEQFARPVILEDTATHSYLDIHADQARDEVCFLADGALVRLDGQTGKRTARRLPRMGQGAMFAVGKDGLVYTNSHHFVRVQTGIASRGIVVRRLDRELKPVPFQATGTDSVQIQSNLRCRGRGLTADPRGNIYVIRQKVEQEMAKDDARDANAVARISPDGKVTAPRLIDAEFRSLNSVRVDAAGNVYLAVGVRPGTMLVPEALRGLALGQHHRKLFVQPHGFNSNQVNWYPMMYGSIVKFPPAGGVFRRGIGGRAANFGCGNPTEVLGAEWLHPEASSIPSWRTANTPDVCLCETPCFDVDGFGRSFFADALRWQVGILDARGNTICRFGDYGNRDSLGPGSRTPVPAIPFTWVQSVAASDEAVYVGDRLSRRIVRVKLAYQIERTLPVPK